MADNDTSRLDAERAAREAEEARRMAILARITELEKEKEWLDGRRMELFDIAGEVEVRGDEIHNEMSGLILADESEFKGVTEREISEGVDEAFKQLQSLFSLICRTNTLCNGQQDSIWHKEEEINMEIDSLRSSI